jgi:hypothetical protein
VYFPKLRINFPKINHDSQNWGIKIPVIVFPLTIIKAYGNIVPVSLTAATLIDRHGNITGVVETFRDLSDLEETRKELTKQDMFHDIICKRQAIQQLFAIPN